MNTIREGAGRLRRGELSTTDRLFGETGDQLGGFLLIKAGIETRPSGRRDDQMARGGSSEVRPIKELRL